MFSEVEASQKALATKILVVYGALLWCSCIYMCCYMTLKTGGEALVTFFIDSGIMWAICVPLAWILVTKTSLSLLYIYPIIIGIDLIKFFIGISFVKKGKWMRNLTLQIE
jgi:Na+-driven multidrug efflux pump